MTCAICPKCGYNLQRDEPIERDGWYIVPGMSARYDGVLITQRVSFVTLLHTVATSDGRAITSDALLNRISDSEDTNVVAVQVSKLRRCLRDAGVPDPLQSVRGRGGGGYRWSPPSRG